MTDIVERLRDYVLDDHERGCQGRYYNCSCGYDDKRDLLMGEAAAEIERLRAALRSLVGAVADHTSQKSIPDALREARAALEGRDEQ